MIDRFNSVNCFSVFVALVQMNRLEMYCAAIMKFSVLSLEWVTSFGIGISIFRARWIWMFHNPVYV